MLDRQTVLVSLLPGVDDGASIDGSAYGGGEAGSAPSGQWIASRVTDISGEGCRLLCPLALEQGMTLHVMFPGFEARMAKVLWVKDGAAGCAFATPLPAAILDYIIRMSDPAARG